MMQFAEKSLTRQMTVVIAIAVILISVLSLMVNLIIDSRANDRLFNQKSREQIAYLMESLELPLWNYDVEAVRKLGQLAMTSDILSFLIIKDSKGALLYTGEKHGSARDITRRVEVVYRGVTVGVLELHFTRRVYEKQQQEMVIAGLVTIFVLISGILGAVVFSVRQFMKKPLADFSRQIDALAGGAYREVDLPSGSRELGTVMSHFRQMAVQIEERELALIKANQVLRAEFDERIKAEIKLRESEEKYRSLNNNIPVGIFRLKPSGEIVDYNAFLMKILDVPLGTDMSSLEGKNFYLHPGDRQIMLNAIRKNRHITGFECQLKSRGDQRLIWASISARGIEDENGEIIYIDGMAEDITEKKAYEKQLARFATIIEQADEEVVITDPEGVIQYVNPSFEKHTGYIKKEVLGKTPAVLSSGQHGGAFYRDLWQTILDKKTWKGIIQNKGKNGMVFLHDTTITPIVDAKKEITAFVSIRRDITRQAEMEKQIQQSQKMQAIGTLAGGIAHDFNNILSGIYGYSQLAQANINNPDTATGNIDNILKAAQRASELVQQILTFSRQTDYEKKSFSIYLEVNEAMKLLRSTIPVTIEIKKQLESRALVQADPTKIHQVVMNLCTNAYHAMIENGGVLTVKLQDRVMDTHQPVRGKSMPPGSYLCMEVSDTGQGMDKATLEKAFDPYFTTKEIGRGTGLGLPIVQAIVEEHDGFLQVKSEPGRGTSFSIYFPVFKKQSADRVPGQTGFSVSTGNETIMVVDDEEAIRQTFKEILEKAGYRVFPYQNGEEALEAFKADPDRFDLIVTDMTMPMKTGAELMASAREIRADIPVILCSGYNDLMNEKEALLAGVNRYFAKPILVDALAGGVRQVLDECS